MRGLSGRVGVDCLGVAAGLISGVGREDTVGGVYHEMRYDKRIDVSMMPIGDPFLLEADDNAFLARLPLLSCPSYQRQSEESTVLR